MAILAASPRLLLLLFVLTGVAAMHTIGHPAGVDHATAGHADAAVCPEGHSAEPVAVVPDGAMPAHWHLDGHDRGMVMNPLNVCLAVLVGGILLLLAAVLHRTGRGWAREHHIMPTRRRTGRGPPTSPILGLVLADLSVQRT